MSVRRGDHDLRRLRNAGIEQVFVRVEQVFVGMERVFVRVEQVFVGMERVFVGIAQMFVGHRASVRRDSSKCLGGSRWCS